MRASQPKSAAALAMVTASEVESAETEATTGLRPCTAPPRVRRTCNFSSSDKVAPSPSEPSATMPAHPFSKSHRQCSAMKRWSIRRSSVKLVVMAGITPFQFISVLLWLRRVLALSHRSTRPSFRRKREKSAAAPNPDSTRKGIVSPVRRSDLDKVPCHSGFEAWLRASPRGREDGSSERPRSGKLSFRPREGSGVPSVAEKYGRDSARSDAAFLVCRINCSPPLGARPRPAPRPRPQPAKTQRLRCPSVRLHRKLPRRSFFENHRPARSHFESDNQAAAIIRCWARDENHKRGNRTG